MDAPLGTWPYVDIVVIKDYEQSQRMKGKQKCFLRLHMDIPLDEGDADTINGFLKKSNRKGVFDKVMEVSPPDPAPDSQGLATLKAALGQ